MGALHRPIVPVFENLRKFRYADMVVRSALSSVRWPLWIDDTHGSMNISVMPGKTPMLLSSDILAKLCTLINHSIGEAMFLTLSNTKILSCQDRQMVI